MTLAGSAPFLKFSDAMRGRIDAALDRYTEPADGLPDGLRAAIRHSLLAPAKRLRPLLVLMAAEACGCSWERALPAACAVEMIHTYSLIHDDLPAMDDDDMRRGLPSCHARFGEAAAILAGDALLALAFDVLARDLPEPRLAAECTAILAQAAGGTALVGGQFDDLTCEGSAGDVELLERIHARKTGALFLASLHMGGAIAEAGPDQRAALETFGRKLGLAFQIVDDLLDLRGDESTLGKRTGKDAERGKLTFPGLLGADASWLRAQELIAQAREAARELAAKTATDNDPGADASRLEALAEYVLERNR